LVLGAVGLIKPIDGDLGVLRLDMLFLGGVTILGVLTMRGNRMISRTEGILLLGSYGTFITVAIING